MPKQYYYHLTDEIWTEKIRLRPRASGKKTPGRPLDEPKDSRICVCPTPWHCLIAVGGAYFFKEIHIYRTLRKIGAYFPHGVVDAPVTQEMWITHPIQFIRIGSIPLFAVKQLKLPTVVGCQQMLEKQRKCLKPSEKLVRKYMPECWNPQ